MSLRDEYPLHPNKVYKKTLSYAISFGLFGIFLTFIFPLLCFPILLAIAGIFLWQKEYYKKYFYDLTPNGLEIRKGVFFPNSITVPSEKISDVYVDQDIFDRLFGLYDLHFSSASNTSGALAHIDGLDGKTNERLRGLLMGKFKESHGIPQEQSAAKPEVIEAFSPAPSGFWLTLISSLIGTFILSIVIADLLGIGLFLLLAIPVAILTKKDFDAMRYEIRKDGIWVKKGWLMPSESLIFYRNIQDIDIVAGLLERVIGLQTVTIKTMSAASAMSSVLSLLSADDAKKFQEIAQKQIAAAASGKIKPSASGFAAPSAAQPATYSGKQLDKPYENHFFKGHLIGNLPILLIFLGIGVVAGISGAWLILALMLFLSCLAFFMGLIMAFIDKSTYSYSIAENGLVIELGLLSRAKKVIRYEKIQDIKIHCGFVESFFGIVGMEVETGSKDMVRSDGQSAANVGVSATERIPYLALSDAHALRAKLLSIAKISYPSGEKPLCRSLPLSPKKPLKKTIGFNGIFAVQFTIALIAMAISTQGPLASLFWGALALFVAVCAIAAVALFLYEKEYLKKYFYDENGETLVIRKGVFGWSEIVVPFRNIQTVYVDQDWYDVAFGLWDIWITTVTLESGQMAHIDGLPTEDADRLVRLLVGRVEKSRKR